MQENALPKVVFVGDSIRLGHAPLVGQRQGKLLRADGTYYTPEGYAMLAGVVAENILRALAK